MTCLCFRWVGRWLSPHLTKIVTVQLKTFHTQPLHCPGGFRIEFLVWGVDSRRCCLLSSVHCSLSLWAPKSIALDAKVCYFCWLWQRNLFFFFTSSVFTIGTKVCYHCELSAKVCYLVTGVWLNWTHLLTVHHSPSIGPILGAKVCHQLLVLAQYQS